MNKNEFPTMEDGNFEWDGYEIHPCKEFTDEKGYKFIETVDDEPETADFWSVYAHLKWGGVECLADCPNRVIAELVLCGLEVTHHPQCPECGSFTNYIDASAGNWRICNDCGMNFEVVTTTGLIVSG